MVSVGQQLSMQVIKNAASNELRCSHRTGGEAAAMRGVAKTSPTGGYVP